MRNARRAALAAVLPVACDGALPDPPDAGPGPGLVVDVTLGGAAYFTDDGEVVDEIDPAEGEAPFALPPAHPDHWGAAYFTHDRYECTRDGHQSVLFLNPPGHPWAEPADLLVYLHGGGLGAFDEGGTYHPAWLSQRDCRSMVDQEDPERLLARWSGDPCSAEWPPSLGIAARLVADADLRIALVSKCDQDVYSGTGRPDHRNPWNRDNRVDGLLATRAAIELAFAEGWTDGDHALLLAGASAGGVGVHTVARTLGEDGRRVAGVISDAAVMNVEAFERIFADAPDGCAFREQVADPADWRPRVGPEVAPERAPQHAIEPDSYPVFQVWSPADATFCSEAAVSLVFDPVAGAIRAQNPGGVSEARPVCIDGECNAHSFIRWAPPDSRDTRGCEGDACEPILEVLHAWLRARRGP
ncbi:MAG TPA: hypothetical protein RMH99_22400 [Sandaracinaceae bacterium LLY-WYZ-13_1]|nr:hypothetical protein [Sandaracinaceae bacterium LLY-WYZ-13_1]